MTLRRSAFAFLLLTSASATAVAAPATPDGAAKIKSGIESYVGSTPGVVSVMPKGEQYEVKLDLAPLAAKLASSGATVTISPWTYAVTDVGNGKWEVVQDEPFLLAIKSGTEFDLKATAAKSKSIATYDETLGAFSKISAEIVDLVIDQTMMTPDGASSQVNYKVKSTTYDATASGTSNAVDIVYVSGLTGLEETVTMPLTPGAPPQVIKISAAMGNQTGNMKGVRLSALKGMLSWLVERASKNDLEGKEAEVRKMLNDALPLFDSVAGDISLDKLGVETPVGLVGIDKVLVRLKTSGAVTAGEFSEALEFEGLTLPPGLVPPFAADLVPQKFAIDFKLSDFNLAEAAKVFINELDTSKQKQSEEFDAKLLAAIIPSGSVSIGTETTRAIAKNYDLSVTGAMKAGPSVPPGGKATIRLKGLDEIVKALQAAPPEIGAAQAVGGLLMAKGFGKADGDAIIWDIDATQPGSVLVNGIDVAKMAGAPAQ
jgi:hypothetical protein